MYDSTLRVSALLLNLVLGHLQLTLQSAVRWSGILGKALSIYVRAVALSFTLHVCRVTLVRPRRGLHK